MNGGIRNDAHDSDNPASRRSVLRFDAATSTVSLSGVSGTLASTKRETPARSVRVTSSW